VIPTFLLHPDVSYFPYPKSTVSGILGSTLLNLLHVEATCFLPSSSHAFFLAENCVIAVVP
jgi:hypothetical protein